MEPEASYEECINSPTSSLTLASPLARLRWFRVYLYGPHSIGANLGGQVTALTSLRLEPRMTSNRGNR